MGRYKKIQKRKSQKSNAEFLTGEKYWTDSCGAKNHFDNEIGEENSVLEEMGACE